MIRRAAVLVAAFVLAMFAAAWAGLSKEERRMGESPLRIICPGCYAAAGSIVQRIRIRLMGRCGMF